MSGSKDIHSFMHCRKCVEGNQTPRLEAGLTESGIRVQCKKHGIIVHITPEELTHLVAAGAQCDCCPDGKHIN